MIAVCCDNLTRTLAEEKVHSLTALVSIARTYLSCVSWKSWAGVFVLADVSSACATYTGSATWSDKPAWWWSAPKMKTQMMILLQEPSFSLQTRDCLTTSSHSPRCRAIHSFHPCPHGSESRVSNGSFVWDNLSFKTVIIYTCVSTLNMPFKKWLNPLVSINYDLCPIDLRHFV